VRSPVQGVRHELLACRAAGFHIDVSSYGDQRRPLLLNHRLPNRKINCSVPARDAASDEILSIELPLEPDFSIRFAQQTQRFPIAVRGPAGFRGDD
jgi:hypothetical protein